MLRVSRTKLQNPLDRSCTVAVNDIPGELSQIEGWLEMMKRLNCKPKDYCRRVVDVAPLV